MALQPPLFPAQRGWRAGLAFAILAFLILFALVPASMLNVVPACTFKKLTGLPCAFCGGTRSARVLLHGDVATALYLNPMALLTIALLLAVAGIFLWEASQGRALADWSGLAKTLKPWSPALLALLVLWWVPHIYAAVKRPKTELVDLHNPVAGSLYRLLHKSD